MVKRSAGGILSRFMMTPFATMNIPISRVVLNSGDCIEVLIIIIILLVKGCWGFDWVLFFQVGFEGYIKD
jgi:hypothetical protein